MKMMFHEEARNNNNININIKRKMKMSKNDKRRFSDEQIRCLELMFESDTKLEPRKKVEVARELGLQPRQVAIWFQNKRARWKSKHIEKEYSSLLSSYNSLASQFESLKKEKQSLLIQLQKLKKESEKENDGGVRYGSSDGESESNNNNNKIEVEVEVEVKNDDLFVEGMMVSNSDDDNSNLNAELLQVREEEEENQDENHDDESLLRMADTSDWGSLDSDDIIINHAANQWWGFSSFID